MTPETYTFGGRSVTMPVEVRRARNWVATFTVPAEAARALVAPTGLEVARPKAGRALVTLGFVEYEDTDLGSYHEFMISIMVRKHDRPPATQRAMSRELRRNDVGVYIHRLPVDDRFSMDAGRGIWGYPKTMMQFERTDSGGATGWSLSEDGKLAVAMRWRPRWLPIPAAKAPPTYTFLDGVLRMTAWESRARGVRARIRGVDLELGEGAIADDLRSLGLPGRAVLSISVSQMRARFGPARVISAPMDGSSEQEGNSNLGSFLAP
jgi:hypothetical protein